MRLTSCNWGSDLPAGPSGPSRDEQRGGTDAGLVILWHTEVLQFVVLVVGTSLDTEEPCSGLSLHVLQVTQTAGPPGSCDKIHTHTTRSQRWKTDSSQSAEQMNSVMNQNHEPRV